MANTINHYQVRLVKRIDSDGTIITFPSLGKIYPLHDQKTIKAVDSLDETTTIAQNLNSSLPSEVKGMVIVRFKRGNGLIAGGKITKRYVKKQIRKAKTTEWLRFISRDNKVFSVSPKSHKIVNKLKT